MMCEVFTELVIVKQHDTNTFLCEVWMFLVFIKKSITCKPKFRSAFQKKVMLFVL